MPYMTISYLQEAAAFECAQALLLRVGELHPPLNQGVLTEADAELAQQAELLEELKRLLGADLAGLLLLAD